MATPASTSKQPATATSHKGASTAPSNPMTGKGTLEEMDGAQISASSEDCVVLSIRVISARNVRGAKGEHVNTFVRVQFADFDFKDSQVVVDSGSPEYNFNVEQSLHVDEGLVDTFANKRATFTLIESLPKEKTQILGTADICFASTFLKYQPRDPAAPPEAPLLPPPLSFKESLPIGYLNARLLPAPSKEGEPNNQPEILFEVSLSRPLLSPEVVENGNFVTIKLDDVFPVPDEWTLKEGTEKDLNSNIYTYSLNLLVPAETTLERLISITGGSLTTCEVPMALESPAFGATPIYLAKPPDPAGNPTISDILGPEVSKLDGTAPQTPGAASDKNGGANVEVPMQSFKKVSWSNGHTIWLPPESVIRLREKILAKQLIEIEFIREFQPRFSHLVDPNPSKYRGKALLDFSSLLFPRVIGLKGRFPLDVFEAPGSPGDAGSVVADSGAGGGKTKGGRGNKDEIDVHLYKTLGTSVGVEIMLEKPLLDKKKLQPITKSVSDFIPHRIIPDDLVFEKRSLKADEDYRIQIQEIVRCLVGEYQHALATNLFAQNLNVDGGGVEETISITSRDVGEEGMRFQRKSPFASKSDIQLFMSEVYVYLVDQMHIAINKMFNDKDAAFADPTACKTADFNLLKRFAEEAEEDHNVMVAMGYHQERIAKFEDSFQAWFDYGTFCMRNSMSSKGIECFKEVLSRNSKHIPSLLAYGSICSGLEKYEEARIFLVTAAELQPTYVLGLTILGLFYDIIGEEMESEKYLTEAIKLSKSDPNEPKDLPKVYIRLGIVYLTTIKSLIQITLPATKSTPSSKIIQRADRSQIELNAARMAKTMFLRACEMKPSSKSWLGVGKACLAVGEFGEAEDALSEANVLNNRDGEVWAYLALLCLCLDRAFEANQAIAQALRVGVKDAEALKTTGTAFYALGNISSAAECLRVAMELDPSDTSVQELFMKAIAQGSRDFLAQELTARGDGEEGEEFSGSFLVGRERGLEAGA
ncbi:Cilia- and flagella-associated protein 70 [Dinochytrium kinnereticum]|nr:Cilia- and flagella-associated protein 70 [Dinochytrium kinnereticum]